MGHEWLAKYILTHERFSSLCYKFRLKFAGVEETARRVDINNNISSL